jgi:hypothetical protein
LADLDHVHPELFVILCHVARLRGELCLVGMAVRRLVGDMCHVGDVLPLAHRAEGSGRLAESAGGPEKVGLCVTEITR